MRKSSVMQSRFVIGLILLAISWDNFAAAEYRSTRFNSGEQQVALIELYTSEGCSSCPPADRWLSSLKSDPGLWRDFAPIAFHVDYWDYIGWKDRFARAKFSQRQRRYAEEGGARTVYTPGFFMNGKEWPGWFRDKQLDIEKIRVGELNVWLEGDLIAARFGVDDTDHGELSIHVAVLGLNLESRVNAGENDGRTLRHDFVALSVVTVALQPVEGGYEAILQLPDIRNGPQSQALVAWVSEAGRQAPIQAVGGFLPN